MNIETSEMEIFDNIKKGIQMPKNEFDKLREKHEIVRTPNQRYIPEKYTNPKMLIQLLNEQYNKEKLERYGVVLKSQIATPQLSIEELDRLGVRDRALSAFRLKFIPSIGTDLFLKMYNPLTRGGEKTDLEETLIEMRQEFSLEAAYLEFANAEGYAVPVFLNHTEEKRINEDSNTGILCTLMSFVEKDTADKIILDNRVRAEPIREYLHFLNTGEDPKKVQDSKQELAILDREHDDIIASTLTFINHLAMQGTRHVEDPEKPSHYALQNVLRNTQPIWMRDRDSLVSRLRYDLEAAIVWDMAFKGEQGFSQEVLEGVRFNGIRKVAKDLNDRTQIINYYMSTLDPLLGPNQEKIKNNIRNKKRKKISKDELDSRVAKAYETITWGPGDERFLYLVQNDETLHNVKYPGKVVVVDGGRAGMGRVEISRARLLLDPLLRLSEEEIMGYYIHTVHEEKSLSKGLKREDRRTLNMKVRDFNMLGIYTLIGAIGWRAKDFFYGRRYGIKEDEGSLGPKKRIPALQEALRTRIERALEFYFPGNVRGQLGSLLDFNDSIQTPYKLFKPKNR